MFFEHYTSNTVAGSGNQGVFETADPAYIGTARTYYKVFCGGAFGYSFLFADTVDSTFADGSVSRANMINGGWTIHRARVGVVADCDETTATEPAVWHPLTVDGQTEKAVGAGDMFHTDPVTLSAKSGEYLCLEMAFSGKTIPYHEESLVPSFVLENGGWTPSKRHPFPSMVGCDRPVKRRIAFFGDSITQGVGTPVNSYVHWNSVVADKLGADNAYWNVGLGFGRAADAATNGAWMQKAKQNDIVVVCFGVNDILRDYSEEDIKHNLYTIVDILKNDGKTVIVQTVPPFDYHGDHILIWKRVNDYIKTELAAKADAVFDCVPLLQKHRRTPHLAKYGGHPNATGCKRWGEAFAAALLSYFKSQEELINGQTHYFMDAQRGAQHRRCQSGDEGSA